MRFEEILKKQIGLVMENNIYQDVVRPGTTIREFIAKLKGLLASPLYSDFLIVYIDSDKSTDYTPISAVITHKEVGELLTVVEEAIEENSKKEVGDKKSLTVADLELEKKFPLKYFVYKDDLIEKAFSMFRTDLTDILIVLDGHNYFGKIKRSQLVEKLRILSS